MKLKSGSGKKTKSQDIGNWKTPKDTMIEKEVKEVDQLLVDSSNYPDMTEFGNTCKTWLSCLILMGPDSCHHHLKGDQSNAVGEPEPLSPTSASLREQMFSLSTSTAEVQTKYECNMKSKLASVHSIRKRLDKMLNKQCNLSTV